MPCRSLCWTGVGWWHLGRNLGLLRHSLCVVTVGCEVEANYWPDVDDVEREDGGPCRLAR